MTVQVPRLPFSLDPLIAEAKRRARQRRFLLALVSVVVALAVGGTVFATRSAASLVAGPPAPGCPAHGAGAGYLASARTGTAAAQRDEERLLCLVVLPQGAQLLTSEPAVMAQLGRRIFSFPKPFAPFARHRFWRVHVSVAALANFEKAHPPAGLTYGCRANAGCGVGVWAGPSVPTNASLTFPLPPIRDRVGSRVLRMTILGLPGGWTALRVDAVNRPWTRGS
jgi:hypothetical protein